jgi:DegV family protein with EDD domain
MKKVRLYAALDTLQYLVKSGRVPQAAALVNSLLSIKPVFTLNGGEAKTIALPRTMKSALDRMFKIMEEETGENRPLHAAVMHADASENAAILKDRITAQFNCKEIYITEFTPVMGAHTGPGLVGVTFWEEGGGNNTNTTNTTNIK